MSIDRFDEQIYCEIKAHDAKRQDKFIFRSISLLEMGKFYCKLDANWNYKFRAILVDVKLKADSSIQFLVKLIIVFSKERP